MKDCPFCPGRPTVTRFSCGDEWNYQPSCPSCGAYIDKEYATYEEAEAAWNHRPGEEAVAEECARIVEGLVVDAECGDSQLWFNGAKWTIDKAVRLIRSRFGGKS